MNNDSRKEEIERLKKIDLINLKIKRNKTIQKIPSIILIISVVLYMVMFDKRLPNTFGGIELWENILISIAILSVILIIVLQIYHRYLRNKIIKVSMNKTDMKKVKKVSLTKAGMKKMFLTMLIFTAIYCLLSYYFFDTNAINEVKTDIYITTIPIIYILSILLIFIYYSIFYIDEENLFNKEFVLKEQRKEIVEISLGYMHHRIYKNFQGRIDKYDAQFVIEHNIHHYNRYSKEDIKLAMFIETKDFDKNIFITNKGDVEKVFINEYGQLEIAGDNIKIDSGKEYRFYVMNEYTKIKNIAKEVLDNIKNNYNF